MIHIKHPRQDQLPALAHLFDAYRIFYRKKTDFDAALRFLTERFKHNESVLFVAEIEGEIVGFIQLYPLFSSTNMAKTWLLNDLYVLPGFRRKNVGKRLMSAAQEHCKTTKALGISLETEKAIYRETPFILKWGLQ